MRRIINERGQPRPSPDAAGPIPAPRFGNPPDSGRPPVEQFPRPISAPGGRPDTTGPLGSASFAADTDRLSGGRAQPHLSLRRSSPSTGQVATTGHLAGAFDELTVAGLLMLADPDPHRLRRVTRTTAGQARHEQLPETPRLTGVPVPTPQFPAIKTSACERLSGSGSLAPARQANPHRPGEPSTGHLRWTRCPDDGHLHLLADVITAATGVYAAALCGRALPAEGLTVTNGSAGTLCMACGDGIASDPGPRGTL